MTNFLIEYALNTIAFIIFYIAISFVTYDGIVGFLVSALSAALVATAIKAIIFVKLKYGDYKQVD